MPAIPRQVWLAPGVEDMVASGTMFGRGQAVTAAAELEVVVDAAMGVKEAQRVPC